jgi:integrase/recombinase XerD
MNRIVSRTRRSRRRTAAEEFRIISEDFERHLAERGYALRSIRHYIAAARHFGRWLGCKQYCLLDVNERLIARFRQSHLPRCHCPPPATTCATAVQPGLRHLLRFLRLRNLCSPPQETCPPLVDHQVRSFGHYSGEVCGLAEATRRYDQRHIRQFLEWRFGRRALRYERLKPEDLAAYLHRRAQALQPSTVRLLAGSLRRFLRFLQLQGKISADLEKAILVPAIHGTGALPKIFTEQERRKLLQHGFNRRSATGRRDYAMALCQLELGLRACEVAALTLEDLDWSEGVLLIHKTKSRRERHLPLLRTVGRALSAYLRNGRPRAAAREVFLRHLFPVGGPLRADTVRGAMREAYRRAGLPRSWMGTHVMRRTFASRLCQRGAGLKSIADLLGHQCLETTTAYTRVDIPQLRKVALPWPK